MKIVHMFYQRVEKEKGQHVVSGGLIKENVFKNPQEFISNRRLSDITDDLIHKN